MELYKENGLKKARYNARGTKMLIESGHKTFDKQTNCLTTGNVIANTQLSFFIRSFNETIDPVGHIVPKGRLRDYDLNHFSDMPSYIRRCVEYITEDIQVILYEIRHFNGISKVIDGYVVTDTNYKHIETFYVNLRACNAVNEARKYFAIMN